MFIGGFQVQVLVGDDIPVVVLLLLYSGVLFVVSLLDKLIDEYNQKVNQYNDLFSSYENIYLEYDRLFDEYEKDIITYDSLVESYNAGVIPPMIQNQLSEEEVRDNIYVIEAGDNLWEIPQKFGTTAEKIIALNELADPRLIKPGQKLIIPQNNN
ncbi:hypothetical protein ES705_47403 [subsurface metagenome]